MNNLISLFLIMAVSCLSLISCKEASDRSEKKVVFQEGGSDQVEQDSLGIHDKYVIDLNIGDEVDRGTWQNPELVIRKLGDLSGKTVADIGSGTGYFTFPISRVAKKVLAIDIEQRYLDYIEDRKLELPVEQANVIETRLTVESEPNLHSGEVDAVLLVNVYYYLEDRIDYMKIVHNALKKDGILVLVDYLPGDLPVGPSENKVTPDDVVEILRQSGFQSVDVDTESLQYQYIITAK